MSAAVDPLASLRPYGLTVTLGGQDYDIEPRNGAQWLTVLLPESLDLADIVPGMLTPEGEQALEEALVAGKVSEREIVDTAMEVIGVAAGRDWWWAMNLIRSVGSVWLSVYGQLVAQGVRFDQLPLGAVLDAMYATVAARMDKERLRAFNSDLARPPAGYMPELTEKAEEQDFLALMNMGR